MAKAESLPSYRRATELVRTACGLPADTMVLPPGYRLLALILTLLMQLDVGDELVASFCQVLESGPAIGFDGMPILPPAPAPAASQAAAPQAAPARETARTMRQGSGLPRAPAGTIPSFVAPPGRPGRPGRPATGPPAIRVNPFQEAASRRGP